MSLTREGWEQREETREGGVMSYICQLREGQKAHLSDAIQFGKIFSLGGSGVVAQAERLP